MDQILKTATVAKQLVDGDELALINKQTLRELSAEEVFTFRLAACDNQVDRDFERFTDKALERLAPMFVGKSVLMDHVWCAECQTARVYGAHVEDMGSVKRIVLRCYMPRTEKSSETINAIETGILKECSVGCTVNQVICNVCGADNTKTCCPHVPGREYEGVTCVMNLDSPSDAYEVSFVAVPAQKESGVIKSKRYGGREATVDVPEEKARDEPETMMQKLFNMMKQKG